MELKLYNTLTRRKEPFRPLDPVRVRMYVCGPTVYDFAHIGNARPVIVFDILYRLLRQLYGTEHVKYVRNITDVDDKINARAAEEYPDLPLNEAIRKVTEATERQFHEDVAALGCLKPDVEPRATEHISEMKELIERLIAHGCAYVAQDHALFNVAAMKDYGKLSNRSLDEMIAGARVEVAPYKRDPMDFVLWKPSKPGEPAWPSPGGIKSPGRPGWHLECSAMSWKHLGETFDIHGGGIDLVFPHHENEIAQSRCAFHTSMMAQVWMHNGFLQVEGEKMAKSAGNFVTIRDLLNEWPGEAVRLAMLQTQYRQPFNWTEAGVREAKRTLDHWYALTAEVSAGTQCADAVTALTDDLNSPQAFASLHELRADAARGSAGAAASLKATAQLMGLLQLSANQWAAWRPDSLAIDESKVEASIAARNAARKAKNFKESDRIRDELAAMGVVLKDNKDGTTTWEVAR
jgi:cysteinyl-tRNA synthetase